MIAAPRRALVLTLLLALLVPAAALADKPVSPIPGQMRDLDFGTVLPGVSQAVALSDPGAGRWVFKGAFGQSVTLTFTALPSFLTTNGNNLTVTYGPTSAAWNTVNDPAGAQVFDPAVGTTAAFSGPPGRIYVWLGGTAVPAGTQAPGTYSSTYTLDVSYTVP